MNLFIARQPVFDGNENIFAYDLALLGSKKGDDHDEPQAEEMVTELFLDIGIDRVVGDHTVFVPVNRDMLVRRSLPMLPPDRVIIEVPSALAADPEIRTSCESLVANGYRLSTHVHDAMQAPRFLDLCSVVKLDVAAITSEQLAALEPALRGHKARLLAVNVQHRGEREHCARLGIDLFQGYRFSAPESYVRREIGIEHVLTFRVLKLVRDPNATDGEIEELLRRDVGLSYKLLRMVNSAAMGGREIWSIGHALRLLGREPLARWLTVLLVTDGKDTGVQAELVHLALVRARMCELLADPMRVRTAKGPLFLVGMLSVIDELLEIPMDVLCDSMQLAPDIRGALISRDDFLGAALHLVETYVAGGWADVRSAATALGIEPATLQPLYLEALAWAGAQRMAA